MGKIYNIYGREQKSFLNTAGRSTINMIAIVGLIGAMLFLISLYYDGGRTIENILVR